MKEEYRAVIAELVKKRISDCEECIRDMEKLESDVIKKLVEELLMTVTMEEKVHAVLNAAKKLYDPPALSGPEMIIAEKLQLMIYLTDWLIDLETSKEPEELHEHFEQLAEDAGVLCTQKRKKRAKEEPSEEKPAEEAPAKEEPAKKAPARAKSSGKAPYKPCALKKSCAYAASGSRSCDFVLVAERSQRRDGEGLCLEYKKGTPGDAMAKKLKKKRA